MSSTRPTGHWEPGHLVLDRYVVDSLIGGGGMGEVYKARDKRISRTVALKVMRLPRDRAQAKRLLARFDREAEVVTRISDEHANVPFIFDRGVEDDRYVIVMEFLAGRDLAEVLRHAGPLEIHDALYVAAETCKPLLIAHRQGVIHRDVKPANIFLCSGVLPAGKARVRLTDFGVSRTFEASTITDEHATVGTPLYIAPEAFRDAKNADARVDLYAMGIVLWEMLSGVHPFLTDREDMPGPAQLFAIHAAVGIPSILKVRSDVPPALAKAIACAVAMDPKDRWPHVDAFLAEIQRELGILLERADQQGTKLRTLFSQRSDDESVAEPPAARTVARRADVSASRGPLAVVRVGSDESEALAYKRTVKVDHGPEPVHAPSAEPRRAAVAVAPAPAPASPALERTTERMAQGPSPVPPPAAVPSPVPSAAAFRPAAAPTPKTPAAAPARSAAPQVEPSPTPAAAAASPSPSPRLLAFGEAVQKATSLPGLREKLEAGLEDVEQPVRLFCAGLLGRFGDKHSGLRITRRMPIERDQSVLQALRTARAEIFERFPDPIDKQWIDSGERADLMRGNTPAAPGASPRPSDVQAVRGAPPRQADASQLARDLPPLPAAPRSRGELVRLIIVGVTVGCLLFAAYLAFFFRR